MSVPRETNGDASRARDPWQAPDKRATAGECLQELARRRGLLFTLPPEPVSAEEMARHDVIVSPVGQAMIDADAAAEKYIREYWAKKAKADRLTKAWALYESTREKYRENLIAAAEPVRLVYEPTPELSTWLTARPVVFALGTAAGALFVLLMRGWAL